MKYLILSMFFVISSFCLYAYADGDPEFVKIPSEYEKSYKKYSTTNRVDRVQLAKIYANDLALSSMKEGSVTAPGSILVMEIYKVKTDDKSEPVLDEDGTYKPDSLAAIAVMEKRENWDSAFPEDHRIGGWGFAIYNTDGTPKENNLPCVACHTALQNKDFLFSYDDLKNFAGSVDKE